MVYRIFLILLLFVCNANAQEPDTLSWPIDKAYMELSWQPEIVDGDTLNYDILENNNLVGNTGDTLFIVSRPVGGLYRYGIIAIDVSGNRAAIFYSDFISVADPDTTPPAIPTGIKVSVRFLDTRFGAVGFDGRFEHESNQENFVLNYTKEDTSQYESIVIGRGKEFRVTLPEPYWVSIGVVGAPDSVRTPWIRTTLKQ